MPVAHHRLDAQTAIRTDLGAIFVSMELSRTTWLITSLSPGAGEKMSKHSLRSSDIAGLLSRFAQLKEKARMRTGKAFPVLVIQEAGLDGFWIHRVLQDEGIESYVVDPASIATSRRRRRAKTDKIDGEALLRALMAYKRGEPRVCAMVKAPTPRDDRGAARFRGPPRSRRDVVFGEASAAIAGTRHRHLARADHLQRGDAQQAHGPGGGERICASRKWFCHSEHLSFRLL
jgi:transposase